MTVRPVTTGATTSSSPLIRTIPSPRVGEPGSGPHGLERDGRPLRVLAIGINFGPEHTGIAPYTTQLCEFLSGHGAAVSVLTGVPHYPAWAVDPGYRWRFRKVDKRDRLEVRRLRHYVPRSQSAARRGLYELTFALQVALQRMSERPDVVLAVVPSLLSAVAAQRIAARAGVPLVVWVQDLMGQASAQSGMSGGGAAASVVGRIERWVLQRADRVLVLNPHFRDHVRSLGIPVDRTTVHPNWSHVPAPSGADRAHTRARLGWAPRETIVLHSGNMGLKQDLGNVIAAARIADGDPTNTVRFVLMGDGSQRRPLQQEADGVDAVTFLDPASTAEYADVLAAADILLVNERPTCVDMSLPSKLTSYFTSGRPVVAASPAHGGTAAEIIRSAGGVLVEPATPRRLLDAVLQMASDPGAAHQMGILGSLYADGHLRAHDALTSLLDAICSPSKGAETAA